jgi:peptidoglycan/xylan/chitin deacetylase (PgdA/CDA1 family)
VYWNQDRYPTLDSGQSGYDPNRIEVGWQLIVWPGMVVAYDPPLPTAAPRPSTSNPTPSSSIAVWNGSRSRRLVALTFDMGGRTDPALAIMTWLRDHGVAATIFMTGESTDTTTAARQRLSIVNARPDVFHLGTTATPILI